MVIAKVIGVFVVIFSFSVLVYLILERSPKITWHYDALLACLFFGCSLIIVPTIIETSSITCSSCESVLNADTGFCTECGVSLVSTCPDCGIECNTPYCVNCGAATKTD